jgi:hypothetical protein
VAVPSSDGADLRSLGNTEQTLCGWSKQLCHLGGASGANRAELARLAGEKRCYCSRGPSQSTASADDNDRGTEPRAGGLQYLRSKGQVELVLAEPRKGVPAGQYGTHAVAERSSTRAPDEFAQWDAEGQFEDTRARNVASD